jgi:hypothetical protein
LDNKLDNLEQLIGSGIYNSIKIYKCASVDTISNTWSGYFYNIEAKEFSEMLTEGLRYKMVAPIVGKCYDEDATMLIDLYSPVGIAKK